ncbi:MAG: HNH endonuclease [Blastocatellia bacterium]
MGSKIGVLKIAAARIGISFEQYTKLIEEGNKWCMKCKGWKAVDKFGFDKTRGDGRTSTCTQCRHVKERISTKGRVSTFKGHKHSEEAKQKMSEAKKGMRLRLGIKHTTETRQKISQKVRQVAVRGTEHPAYKDGKLAERRGQRFSTEYKQWRYDVFIRDNFTCQTCGDDRGGNLVAHHIKPFADYPELRFDVSNGITLCETCHDSVHSKQA